MRGTMLTLKVDGTTSRQDFSEMPHISVFQKAVGGYIEVVPHFHSIWFEGKTESCVAFCNEEGKLRGAPVNPTANVLWQVAAGPKAGRDTLVGDVIVLYGDDDFMDAL